MGARNRGFVPTANVTRLASFVSQTSQLALIVSAVVLWRGLAGVREQVGPRGDMHSRMRTHAYYL